MKGQSATRRDEERRSPFHKVPPERNKTAEEDEEEGENDTTVTNAKKVDISGRPPSSPHSTFLLGTPGGRAHVYRRRRRRRPHVEPRNPSHLAARRVRRCGGGGKGGERVMQMQQAGRHYTVVHPLVRHVLLCFSVRVVGACLVSK